MSHLVAMENKFRFLRFLKLWTKRIKKNNKKLFEKNKTKKKWVQWKMCERHYKRQWGIFKSVGYDIVLTEVMCLCR